MESPLFTQATTIFTQVRAECGIGSNPISTALQDTAMLRQLHDVNSDAVNYAYRLGLLGWKFLRRETTIITIANTTINGALTSGTTSITLTSGTSWDDPAAGSASTDIAAGYVKTADNIFDFFTYTDISGTSVTGVEGISRSHATLEEAHKVYQLPTDFGKMRALFRESRTYLYEYLDEDKAQVPPFGFYMVKSLINGTKRRSFLVFPEDIGALDWSVYYMKRPTTIDEVTDYIDMPDGNGRRYIVEKMKEYVWSVLGEENDAALSRQRAEKHIQDLASEWSVATLQPNRSLYFAF